MSKYVVTIPDNPVTAATIREFDEDEARDIIRDEIRDELYDEIKEEMVADIQAAADDHEMELDTMVNRIENEIDDLLTEVQGLKDSIEELSSETAFRVEDHI